jgi:small subunit ribosomal protein S2
MSIVHKIGRRKTSVARVYVKPGTGNITVNGKDAKEYFSTDVMVYKLNQPFILSETVGQYDVTVNVFGGGNTGQAEAIRLGISRALCEINAEFRLALKPAGLLTRDARMVERKKPGQKKQERDSNSQNVKISVGEWLMAIGYRNVLNFFKLNLGEKPIATSKQKLPVTFSIQTLLPSKEVVDCLKTESKLTKTENMAKANVKDLLEAGVHFGHMTRKWNPNMAPYIFMEKNGIHIVDLHKTAVKLDEACNALEKLTSAGKKVLFVATKKQAKEVVAKHASELNMPYITERWPGGMLTNFVTIRKAVKKMNSIDKMKKDGTFETLSKKERLQVDRQRANLEKNLGSIADMVRLPSAVFVVDILREHIAVTEAKKLGIPVFGIVDTNSDPRKVDFVIPGNDDASKSIDMILA